MYIMLCNVYVHTIVIHTHIHTMLPEIPDIHDIYYIVYTYTVCILYIYIIYTYTHTYTELKALIREVDDDQDGLISLTDFITLFRRRQKGELIANSTGSDLVNIFNRTVNVNEVGVEGAKAFFEGKTKLNTVTNDLAKLEIFNNSEERKIKKEEKIRKKEEFDIKRDKFKS